MKKIEIILTQAIEVDFLSLYEKECRKARIKCKYTKIENVKGAGNTNPKLGDAIWPQLNIMFILYLDEEFVPKISKIMENLHKNYVGEGAIAFVSDVQELL